MQKELRINAADFLAQDPSIPVLDIRSPGEYAAGHIPGAISFPLFSNEERAVIGTLYKQEGQKSAIKQGLEIVGPKMRGFIEQAESLHSPTLALYCWRGGMRSATMAQLFAWYGFGTVILKGGYKAYRNEMIRFFSGKLPLKVVTGYTGSNKTGFLHDLQANGAQIVDLEGLARHQGSSFGNKKSDWQPTTEHFQNLVFAEFLKLDLQQPIWIEDESQRIGDVNLHEALFARMSESPHIYLEVSKAQRAAFLVKDYGEISKQQAEDATLAISKKLGGLETARVLEALEKNELQEAAEILLVYYDKFYEKSISKKNHLITDRYTVEMTDLPRLAAELAKNNTHAI
ncbi:MAG: tRNA 2-selenouridine(34) synthase MnmH [Bacteroidia bacterium]|nr:tRNA 2-selenouridine(34) synthase MnmH [Bacteroidia bacterium]